MNDLIHEAIALHNLPATLLLALMVGYWLLVLLGFLEEDAEPMDIDGDGAPDSLGHTHGFWLSVGRFLYLGEMPVMVVGSFFAVSLWMLSMLGNWYLNGEPDHRSAWIAVGLLVPNVLLSAVFTRIAAAPFRQLFSAMDKAATEVEAIMGREGIVTSAQVDERYGQVSVTTNAAPLLVNARVAPGETSLLKGSAVRVTAAGPDDAFYYIKPLPSQSS